MLGLLNLVSMLIKFTRLLHKFNEPTIEPMPPFWAKIKHIYLDKNKHYLKLL